MKKLMVVVALVCAAVVSHAATVQWNVSGVSKDGNAVTGISYFINSAELSRTAMLALAGQGATKVAEALSSSTIQAGAATVTSGAKANGTKVANADLGLEDGTAYSFYMVVFNTDTITDDSYFFVSSEKTNQKVASGTSNKVIGIGNMSTASSAQGAWAAVAPEPTSGLLLLIGMAGLALRRRRA